MSDFNTGEDDIIDDSILRLRYLANIRNSDSSFYRDERFIDWIARDARAQSDAGFNPHAWDEQTTARVASRIRSAVSASKCRIQQLVGWPEWKAPPIRGSATEVLEDALQLRSAPCLDISVAAGIGRELWDEECDSWVELPENVPNGSYVALKVSGDSMKPLLHAGDIVLVKLGQEASPGDVVIARAGDAGFVIKRVGRVTGAFIDLLSVNSEFPPLRVARADRPIIGTALLSWCGHN